jgi:hypothetical protein
MSVEQVAVNAKAIRNLAARLERLGYTGDCHTEAEHIAVNLLADGYRRIEPIPDLRPATIAPDDSPGRREFRQVRAELAQRDRNRATADPNGVTR